MSRRSSEITSVDWYSRDVIRVRDSENDASILSAFFFPPLSSSLFTFLRFLFAFSFFFSLILEFLRGVSVPARNRVQSARSPVYCSGFVASESSWSRARLAALNSPFGESLVALSRERNSCGSSRLNNMRSPADSRCLSRDKAATALGRLSFSELRNPCEIHIRFYPWNRKRKRRSRRDSSTTAFSQLYFYCDGYVSA